MKNIFKITALAFMLFAAGCQKMDRPGMGDYPVDANPPGGPLSFYVAFDGNSQDPLRNAVDSVKANFPSDNPLSSETGISGLSVKGEAKKFIKYPSFNGWAANAKSFTFSVWFKKNGQTQNNGTPAGNGPEYFFSLRTAGDPNGYHWSNSIMIAFLEGNNTACAVKIMTVSASNPADPNSSPVDHWFEWAGGQSIAGILDNQWHHLAAVYDENTSTMTLYIDGVANPNTKTWNGHGAIALNAAKIGEYRIGRGPRNDSDGDGESGWLQSSFKGNLDQFRLYQTALTAAEVNMLFTQKK